MQKCYIPKHNIHNPPRRGIMGYILKAFRIMAIVTDWASQAFVDGKVNLREAVDLVERIAKVMGIATDIRLPK